MQNVDELIKVIKDIHPVSEVKNGVLHLFGNVRGYELEKIGSLWNGRIYVDNLVGPYHHPSEIPLKVGRNYRGVTGNLANAIICCKTKKKLKKDRKRLLAGKGWLTTQQNKN